ncbi:DUF819 family protein [Roseivirga sp. UBA838]|uniref:DUF819 family protein n=1 Tax=Roseivirga sp. UBA838 TaxID=1947393 RepID=UPI0025799609|nr:DUF819 family protein [Roseivirga sp. UBA838]|tara:strand:+ start:7674 stop:8969 length:1296 start_codon:yes stop_codon:yes gene_type:complete
MKNSYTWSLTKKTAMPVFTNDAIVLGLLIMVVACVFYTSSSGKPFWKKFYTIVPSILLCYFLPALLNWPLGLIDGEQSNLYYVASRYLLPASLVLLCLSIDLKGIMNLGPKAIIMFLAATVGIVLGGPLAILLISSIAPGVLDVGEGQEVWRGLSTVAGSWIGGGANQASMKEIFKVGEDLFATMIVVDVICANIWTGFLLYGANISKKVDAWLKSDTSAIDDLKRRVEEYQAGIAKIPTLADTYMILAIAFGGTALAHWGSDLISPMLAARMEWLKRFSLESLASGFFWIVVIATTVGVGLSFTRLRKYEGAGASRLGSVFIFILVATIGMKMNIREVFDNLGLFSIGITWMLFHVLIMVVVAKLIKAPFFFVAVGSQANVGGAASAPVVASAFSPALAPVGVLLAVLGYALGTYGALICAFLMERASAF